MKKALYISLSLLLFLSLLSCQSQKKDTAPIAPKGMVWIPTGTFIQGAVPYDEMALAHEKPRHEVNVEGFFMDITEVTNQQFAKFVAATNYRTVAERVVDWEIMKKQLPKQTPKPPDSLLQPGSLTFNSSTTSSIPPTSYHQWWQWTLGANWKNPTGSDRPINNREQHPVVHICFEDAQAYCSWARRRLPTETEWEYAARANKNTIYSWGDHTNLLHQKINSWNGEFPLENTQKDGFKKSAPVQSYPPNDFGLYDMSGNVWEWTSSIYTPNYYQKAGVLDTTKFNSIRATCSTNMDQSTSSQMRVIKGGSFLCHNSYCASYRISSRMNAGIHSSTEHLGFRTVATPDMLE